MSAYTEVVFELQPFEPWNEVLVAYLAEIDFESFQEEEPLLKAYVQTDLFDEIRLKETLNSIEDKSFKIIYTIESIEQQNWNAVWESQFEPVEVGTELLIKAPFHSVENFNGLIVEIEPKMSFGTGHHQTTFLVCQEMLKMDFSDKKVLDMGAGTGVLAILAEKLGASYIEAVEIEPWSAENCDFNAKRNGCERILSLFGDFDVVRENQFDVILANINKNVLKSQLEFYTSKLKSSGLLLLSGFFTSDNDELISHANQFGFSLEKTENKENWSMLKFTRQ